MTEENQQPVKLSTQSYFGLGRVPIGIGAEFRGWDITEKDKKAGKICAVDFRALKPRCLHDCFHCFTDKQKHDLTLEQIINVIDQIAELGARGIDYVGEGEPMLDLNLDKILEYTVSKGIIPILFTDAATALKDNTTVIRYLRELGVSIVPKMDSLFNEDYQNWVVGDKNGRFFYQRNRALKLLIEHGFNESREDGTTCLGFDMVLTKRNMNEVERTLRYCRENNIWAGFAWFLPSGRSGKEDFDRSLVVDEEEKQKIRELVRKVDLEYGFVHPIYNNYATHPCVEFIQIYGDGRVSPCPANETVIGNVKEESLRLIAKKIIEKYPEHNFQAFDGQCLYRSKITISS